MQITRVMMRILNVSSILLSALLYMLSSQSISAQGSGADKCLPIDTMLYVTDSISKDVHVIWTQRDPILEGFNYRYRPINDTSWTDINTTMDTFFIFSDLPDCNQYVFEVRPICPFDTAAYYHDTIASICDTSGLNHPDNPPTISIYPNPVQDQIQFIANTDDAGMLSIYTMSGESVLTTRFEDLHQLKLQTEHLMSGVYLMEVRIDGKPRVLLKFLRL